VNTRQRISIAVSALLFVVTGAFTAALLLGDGTTEPLGSALAIRTLASLVATMIASAGESNGRGATRVATRYPLRSPGSCASAPKSTL
jgi:hypothetical protein